MALPVDQSVSRRDLVLGASASAALAAYIAALGAGPAAAQPKPAPSWEEALRKIIGDAKPTEGQIKLEVPDVAENGNTVPFTVTADSPMSQLDFVRTIHVLATENPIPTIAAFHFTPHAGMAAVSSRVRLAKTQDLVIVAAHSTGRMVMHRRTVRVTIGGCGG